MEAKTLPDLPEDISSFYIQATESIQQRWPRTLKQGDTFGLFDALGDCVAPGLIKTDFARALWEDEKRLRMRTETTPLRRIGEPDDIGGVIAFLASRAAAFITGGIIVADGGVTIT